MMQEVLLAPFDAVQTPDHRMLRSKTCLLRIVDEIDHAGQWLVLDDHSMRNLDPFKDLQGWGSLTIDKDQFTNTQTTSHGHKLGLVVLGIDKVLRHEAF